MYSHVVQPAVLGYFYKDQTLSQNEMLMTVVILTIKLMLPLFFLYEILEIKWPGSVLIVHVYLPLNGSVYSFRQNYKDLNVLFIILENLKSIIKYSRVIS